MNLDKIIEAIRAPDETARMPSILLYVDSPDFYRTGGSYGTKAIQGALRAAGYRVVVHAWPAKLSAPLLEQFDEVWFFLLREEAKGGLDPQEIDALRAWMDGGGGVLITGDHANGDGMEDLRGLGRQIGSTVPRARHLRDWTRPGVAFTQRRHNSTTVADREAEADSVPQRLLVVEPPHPLLVDRPRFFPDHPHEGRVLAPALGELDPEAREEWGHAERPPPALPPDPRVIARGVDWERGELFDLMIAWDGDEVGVGRILADASWHHYVDYNLANLTDGDRRGIFDFYVEQAAWLLPSERRTRRIARVLRHVTDGSRLIDAEYNDVRSLGEDALATLRCRLPTVLFVELMAALEERAPLASALLSDRGFKAHWIGDQLRRLRHALDRDGRLDAASIVERIETPTMLARVIETYSGELRGRLEALAKLAP